MAADLAAADQHRRELIANVSHELRTPITALQAVLENIVDGVAEPDPTTLRTALAQTERLGRLVTELLDLSRLDAGAHRAALGAVRGTRRSSTRSWPRRRCMATGGRARRPVRAPRWSRPTPWRVGDRDRLKQVLLNLVDNAARHSPAGGVVGRHRPAPATDGWSSTCATTGPGIPPEERELVFERFTRGERATGGGTGLGLAIARWIVRLHGGTIEVVDRPVDPERPGPGCLIRVTLPRQPELIRADTDRSPPWLSRATPHPRSAAPSPASTPMPTATAPAAAMSATPVAPTAPGRRRSRPCAPASVAPGSDGTGPAVPAPMTPLAVPAGPVRPPSPRRWPGPGPVAPSAVPIAAVVAGLMAAAALTWDRPGIGWIITGLAVTAGIVVAAWDRIVGQSRP